MGRVGKLMSLLAGEQSRVYARCTPGPKRKSGRALIEASTVRR